jgi:DNA-binding HxlR family transcriptional regulator
MKLQKTTEAPARATPTACCTANALEILGDRWALLTVRELMLAGPG